MRVWSRVAVLVVAVALLGVGWAEDKGQPTAGPTQGAQQQGGQQVQGQQQQTQQQSATPVLPQWSSGQQWAVQSQTYQMQVMGPAQWLPTVQWQYQVAGQQQVGQVPCQVIQVTAQGQPRPVMRLFVSIRDLNLVQLETTVQVGGQEQVVTQQYGPGQLPAFYQLGPAPSQLPQVQGALPPPARPGQKAMPVTRSFRATVSAGQGISFEAEVKQTVQAIGGTELRRLMREGGAPTLRAALPEQALYKVTLEAPGLKTMQVIGTKSPWPIYSQTPTQKSWLVGFTPR